MSVNLNYMDQVVALARIAKLTGAAGGKVVKANTHLGGEKNMPSFSRGGISAVLFPRGSSYMKFK